MIDEVNKQHVFIIGSKGIPASYGGFETFVENLTRFRISEKIVYHVACLGDENKEFIYNKACCFTVKVPSVGSARAILYDLIALKYSLKLIKKNNIQRPIIYILACRIGPFIGYYKKDIEACGGGLFVNPDGHEWKRSKWNWLVRRYWKLSEKLMVKYADLLICDSKNIEKYIQNCHIKYQPKTTFIAYGATTEPSGLSDQAPELLQWYDNNKIKPNEYYLIVGRFVPENNYKVMLEEFMKSETTKDLVIITGIDNNKFYNELKKQTKFNLDSRIKFVGTVYDQKLLKKIRENAYAYIHGHEVGGTNPSLLEALGSTIINLLLDVGFNREVGEDGALYWKKDEYDLSILINQVDKMNENDIKALEKKAKQRIIVAYTWRAIVEDYEQIFKDFVLL